MGFPAPYTFKVKFKAYNYSASVDPWQELALYKYDYEEKVFDQSPFGDDVDIADFHLPNIYAIHENWFLRTEADNPHQWRSHKENGTVIFGHDNKRVYIVNTDQYESVGEITVEFFSNNEDHLKEFLNDMGLSNWAVESDSVITYFS